MANTETGIGASTKVILKWWRTWKTLPVLAWVRAASSYRRGNFQQAEKFYLHGLKRHCGHPAESYARLDLAYCLFKNGKIEQAEKELRVVISSLKKPREALMRLARLQLWSGRPLEAAWTIRRMLRDFQPDADMVEVLCLAVIENGGPVYLYREAREALKKLDEAQKSEPRIRAVKAGLNLDKTPCEEARAELEELSSSGQAALEALTLFAEILLREDKVAHARMYLKRALAREASHPRVLGLLAETYLREGALNNAVFAVQLATAACQNSQWLSVRSMHILAQAYRQSGDSAMALIMAEKAKKTGNQALGEYAHARSLNQLIDELSVEQAGSLKSRAA